ncbi:hypothetical protein CBS101457_003059 [Exobasidium rhododendri]|nr:hypothetical protein CBS101457_003059 [Exobasidium rhododendri]
MSGSSSNSSDSSQYYSSLAEKRLAEIKAKNAESQRRRRLRMKEERCGLTESVDLVSTIASGSRRRQQNDEAQQRRRQKLKDQNKQESEATVHGREAGRMQLTLHRETPPLSWKAITDNIGLEEVASLCEKFRSCAKDPNLQGSDITEAYKGIHARLFKHREDLEQKHPYNHIVADYLQYEQGRLGLGCMSSCLCDWSKVPANMIPTKIQVAYADHQSCIDLLPWPSFRDRLILFFDKETIDPDTFYFDTLQHPLITGKDYSFVVRGEDPVDVSSWEVSEWFFLKYKCLFDQDIIEATNFWRTLRGESLLFFDTLCQTDGVVPTPCLLDTTTMHSMQDELSSSV